jgi:heme exporter protein A
VSPAAAGARLEVTALRCERGAAVLFDGIAFAVEAGEALMVLGPNGSGKTSLLRILAGLARPAAGRVTWQGEALRRTQLLYLGHTVPLKDELSVLENLELALAFDGVASDRAELFLALGQVGLLERRDLPARHLSMGQRRRLGLARVRRAARRLWLLDEPTTGLDHAGIALLEASLAEHLEGGGLAVLTSHQALRLPGPVRSFSL